MKVNLKKFLRIVNSWFKRSLSFVKVIPDKIQDLIKLIMQKCSKLKDFFVGKYKKIKKKAHHKYHLYHWILTMKVVRGGKSFFLKHFGILRRIVLVLLTVLIGYVVLRFSGTNYTADILSNYLITAGSMVGGTIAIVFTISIFLLQSAADLYSSQYLEVYVHDWKEKIIYFIVILIGIVLLGLGLYVGSLTTITENTASFITISSLILISFVFVLIDWQYKTVREKINPTTAILFLENRGRKFLSKLRSDATKLATIIKTGNDIFTEEMALATAYNTALTPFIDNFDKQLENIIQIATRLADRQEVQTSKRAFSSFYHLISGFFELRKTSSIIVPASSTFFAVQSDSRSFLVRNYERLNKAGEKFINEGKEEYASYLVQVYRWLAIKASDINFVGRTNENPILEGLESYLGFFIEYAERAKNIEVSYQGTIALGDIAVLATQKGYETIIFGVQKRIFERATFALVNAKEHHAVILDQCINNYLDIITASFADEKLYRKHVFDDSLKYISKISVHLCTLMASGYIQNDFSTRTLLSKGFDHEFQSTIAKILNHYDKIEGERKRESYRHSIVDLFEEITTSLRRIAEEVKECDGTLADSIGRLLSFLNEIIVQSQNWSDFNGEKEKLIECLHRNIYIPSSFVYHAKRFDGSSNSFRSLNESVTKVGIWSATKLNNKELAKKSALSLCTLAEATLEKSTNSYGYDAPRVLEKACYIAILAMKKGWDDVVEEVISKIYDFEYKYFEKHFTGLPDHIDPFDHNVLGLPHPNQLMIELTGWSHDFISGRYNRRSIHDNAKDLMLSLIEQIDIDRFTFRVWQTFSSPSPLEEELERKSQQKRLLNVLANLK